MNKWTNVINMTHESYNMLHELNIMTHEKNTMNMKEI